jgi:hypothetical protein
MSPLTRMTASLATEQTPVTVMLEYLPEPISPLLHVSA